MAVVFGVFDRLHDGHRFFLRKVQTLLTTTVAEDEDDKKKIITVVITPDSVVDMRKGKNINRQTQTVRCAAIEIFNGELQQQSETVLTALIPLVPLMGDEKEGEYSVLRKKQSECLTEIICLGYDQQALLKDLTERMNNGTLSRLPIHIIDSLEPEKLHTSLLFPVIS